LDDEKKLDTSSHINAITFIKNTKGEAIFTVDTDKASIDEVLKDIIHGVSVEDITIEDTPLEEIISRIYETQTS
jgi:ABC-type uncharacterized transport system ATPase subunit